MIWESSETSWPACGESLGTASRTRQTFEKVYAPVTIAIKKLLTVCASSASENEHDLGVDPAAP